MIIRMRVILKPYAFFYFKSQRLSHPLAEILAKKYKKKLEIAAEQGPVYR